MISSKKTEVIEEFLKSIMTCDPSTTIKIIKFLCKNVFGLNNQLVTVKRYNRKISGLNTVEDGKNLNLIYFFVVLTIFNRINQ
jgi:hypothetical protein